MDSSVAHDAGYWPTVAVVDASDAPCTAGPDWARLLTELDVPTHARTNDDRTADLVIIDARASIGGTQTSVRPGTAIGIAGPDAAAIDRLVTRGCHTVLVDDADATVRVARLLAAALPGRGRELHRVLAALTRAGSGDALDPAALIGGGARTLERMFGVEGIAYLRSEPDTGRRRVVAATGRLAALEAGAVVVARHAAVDVRGPVVVALDRLELARDDAVGFHRFDGLMLAVGGVGIDAMVIVTPPSGPTAGLIDVARALALVADRGLARARTEQALREQVAELDALRELQAGVQAARSTPELVERLLTALVATVGDPDIGLEAELDGVEHRLGPTVRDPDPVDLTIVVADRPRGRVRVGLRGTPECRARALAACRSVVDVVAAHLTVSESRRLQAIADERQRRVLAELPAAIWTVDVDGGTETLSTGALVDDAGAFAAWQAGLRPHLDALVARGLTGEQVRTRLHWQDRVWDVRVAPITATAFDDVTADAPGEPTDGATSAPPGEPSGARTASAPVGQVLVLATDVTELQAARATEAQLLALLDTAQLGIVVVDLDGTLRAWNRGAEALYGWSAAEMVGRHVGLLAPDEEVRHEMDRRLADSMIGRTVPSYIESRRRHRDGHTLEVGIYLAPITDPAGDLLGLAAIYLDLTERNEARRERQLVDRQFLAIAEAAQDVIYRARTRPELAVEFVSPACEQVLGFTAEEFRADPRLADRRIHPGDRQRFLARAGRADEPFSVRVRFQHGDGRWRWVEDRRTPLVVDGRTVAVTGVVRDVSAEERAAEALRTSLERERRAVEELRALDDMKNAFLSAVSHELRTPLTGIVGFAETAARLHAGADPDLAALLDRLVTNASRLDTLVRDLLDIDRLTTGDVAPRREQLDLGAVVTETLTHRESSDHRIEVDVEPTPVAADRTMLERIVDNLVRNAQRHTPAGTTIWVRTGSGAGRVTLTVEDDGPGVPAELHDRVFEPFQQAPDRHTAASPGTGIGLALVQRFVALHGGEVRLDDRPGGGARFRLWLPTGAEASG